VGRGARHHRKGRDEPIQRGRPPVNTATDRDIGKLTAKGMGILKFAKTLGIGTSVVQHLLLRHEGLCRAHSAIRRRDALLSRKRSRLSH
jgi:hypothetical protein